MYNIEIVVKQKHKETENCRIVFAAVAGGDD